MMLVALVAMAQKSVTISPIMKVGMQKTYTIRTEATNPGSAAADITGEIDYKVIDKTSDGFQVDMKSSFKKIDASQITQSITTADLIQLLNAMNTELLTTKQGQIAGIKNAQELVGKCHVMIDSIVNGMMSKNTEMLNNEELKTTMLKSVSMMKDMIDEKLLLESFIQTPSISMLNGKTISEGMEEDGVFAKFFKTKTTYTLLDGGKTIVLNTKGDVDKKSMREYLLKVMDRLLPESVLKKSNPEQLTSMIENMISNGSLQVGMNQKVTCDIGDDGWVKKLVMEMDMNMPGQSIKTRQVQTLKE